jgi:RHS repeat-associated protein
MTYDDNGNLRTLKEAGQTTTYTWDARDRLVGLSGPGLSASFGHDAKRRRISKTIGAFLTTFLFDGVDIIKEVAGGATVNYLRGMGIDEHLARIEDGGTSCYAPDALGSIFAISDAGGGISTEYTYEPFGWTAATGSATQNAFQFTGRENDSTRLYGYRLRYYFPELSRFISEDPIGSYGGMNVYSYVSASPIQRRDPFGLAPDCVDCPGGVWSGAGVPVTVAAGFGGLAAGGEAGIYRVCCWSSSKCCTLFVACPMIGGIFAGAGISAEGIVITGATRCSNLAGYSHGVSGSIGLGPRIGGGGSFSGGAMPDNYGATDYPPSEGFSFGGNAGLGLGGGFFQKVCRTRVVGF